MKPLSTGSAAPSSSPVYAPLASLARLFSCFFPTAEPVHRLQYQGHKSGPCIPDSRVVFFLFFKGSLSYSKKFSYSHANETHFHMKGCALGLTLKKRHKTTQKCQRVYCIM